MIMRDGGWWRKSPLFSYKVNIRTSKDDTMQCRILPREHRTPGLPWRCWNHCSRSSHKPGGEGRGVTGITGTGADEADQARGLLWSSMLLIFSNFRIAELGIAWRTCEMDRILCHKAVALMDALELGACLKGSLALLIFGTFSIFSFQKTYRYTDHTQIMHRSYTDHILLSPRLGPNMCWKQISNRANDNANLQPRAHWVCIPKVHEIHRLSMTFSAVSIGQCGCCENLFCQSKTFDFQHPHRDSMGKANLYGLLFNVPCLSAEVEVQHATPCYAYFQRMRHLSSWQLPSCLWVLDAALQQKPSSATQEPSTSWMSHPPSLLHPFSIPSPSLLHPFSIPHPSRTWWEKVAPGSWSMSSIQVLAELVHLLQCLSCLAA